MQRTTFPFLTIAVLILGTLAVIQPSQPIESADPVNGCGWDRDTLAREASGFPGITEIITGRFERPPALFYEMRLERVARKLESDPDNLGLYDDACVACDRLNRQDEAIVWMEGKNEPPLIVWPPREHPTPITSTATSPTSAPSISTAGSRTELTVMI